MVLGGRHVGIPVKDMERSLAFYRDLLGLVVKKDYWEKGEYIDSITGIKEANVWMIKLTAPDGWMVELLEYRSHPGNPRGNPALHDVGHAHIALTVDDLGKEYKRLKKEGILFNSSPQLSPDNYAWVAFCQDPDGNYVELVEII